MNVGCGQSFLCCSLLEDVTGMKLVREQTAIPRLVQPRLMKTFDFIKLVLKIVEVFLCPAQLKKPFISSDKIEMDGATAHHSTQKSLVPAHDGPTPSVFLPEWLMAWSLAVSSAAETSGLFGFLLRLPTRFSYQSNMDSVPGLPRPPETTARTHGSLWLIVFSRAPSHCKLSGGGVQ